MELTELRNQIDTIDDQLVDLFVQRMEVAAKIAGVKKEKSLPVFVPAREREKLADVAKKAGPGMEDYTRTLYSVLFELSRAYQNQLNGYISPLYSRITQAIAATPQLFPQNPMVACQGIEGAHSQIAAEKMFKNPFILYFKSFDGVFSAIEQGLCWYGVLPLENSMAGSVKSVYDLLIRHQFSIVRSFRMKADHNLLAKPGTKLSDIREIYAHERSVNQCGAFLQQLEGITVTPVTNTAMAAELVCKSDRNDIAAISSRNCTELYGLECLAGSIQDRDHDYTRFICVSRDLEIYPGSDRTSIMAVLPHRPGSLYQFLARLYTLGINVTKVESRSIYGRDFESMFYLDLETSVYSDEFVQLMCTLDDLCEEFQYLGSYREVL